MQGKKAKVMLQASEVNNTFLSHLYMSFSGKRNHRDSSPDV